MQLYIEAREAPGGFYVLLVFIVFGICGSLRVFAGKLRVFAGYLRVKLGKLFCVFSET